MSVANFGGSEPLSDERLPTDVDQHIGARVRLRRMALNISQERLAQILGLTFQQVQKYEKGVNRIAASRLWVMAQALDVRVDYFFHGLVDAPRGDRQSAGEPVFDLIASPDGAQLASAYSTINNSRIRRGLLDLMRSLAE